MLNPDRWQEVSPYLDQALNMPPEERSAWLSSLRDTKPELATLVQSLLEEHVAVKAEDFLEHSPVSVAEPPALAGQTVGAYKVVSLLGQGGMGSVWLAQRSDGRFERGAAIKFLNFSLLGRGGEERFKREGKILGQLAHPHIADLLDAGVSGTGQPFLVLEYVDGRRIDRYCDERKLDVEARIRLFLDVLAAVAHAHTHLTIHRDIKPSNVLVTNDGQAKLLDFGIAKLLQDEGQAAAATMLTQEAGSALTLEYAAPEQVTGGAVTTATDVYALGVLLYLLLTGQHPAGPGPYSAANLIKAIVESDPPRPSDLMARGAGDSKMAAASAADRGSTPDRLSRVLRGDLDTIVLKALKKNPAERYASVTALSDDLSRYLKQEPISARPDTLAYRASKLVRRNRVAFALATLAVIVTIGGIAGTLFQAYAARRQRDSALRERDRASRITEFMSGMFKVSDPSESRGNSVTAREILDRASKEIGTGLTNDPQTQAQLMDVMGNVYGSLGLYSRAQPLLEQAVEIDRRVLGQTSRETLKSMDDLSVILFDEGRYPGAEKLQRETLDSRRKALGPEHPETLISMRHLSATLVRESAYTEAEKLGRESLEIQKRVLGPEHPDTLVTMNDLGWDLDLEGRYADAEKLQRAALDAQRRVLGPENPDTLSTANNLAWAIEQQGRYAEAEQLARATLDTERRVLGSEHPNTLRTIHNLAWTLQRERRYAEAEKLLREVVEIQSRVLGPEHPETLSAKGNLAWAIQQQGRYAEAETLERQLLDVSTRVFGRDSRSTFVDMVNLAGTLQYENRFAEAEKLYYDALEIQRRVIGPEHPDTAITWYNLACVEARQGHRDQAIKLLRQSVDHGLRVDIGADIDKDPDFKSLHGDARFEAIVADAKQRAAAASKPN